MRQHACLPPSFWQDVVETALHIYNRQPMRRLDWSTPILKWNGDVPDVSYVLQSLWVLGLRSYP